MLQNKKVILSGVQPSNRLMLGNYLGAIKNWVHLQNDPENQCIFCVVNAHAITVPQNPQNLRQQTFEAFATYLACGIDTKKSIVFVQSQVSEHAELAWVLGCYTWLGELNRMTQFKDKSTKLKTIGAGLYFYPVLMAADILLYNANLVPVGQDQKQHLELARDLAIRMNNLASTKDNPLFVVPEAYIPPIGSKIMSLQNPQIKMSKSDENENSTIFITDSDDQIMKKFKKAVTDSGTEIEYSDDKPGIKNLINIQAAITGKTPEEIVKNYQGKLYGHLKIETAEMVIETLRPIKEKISIYLSDKIQLENLLKDGALKAKEIASKTLKRTYEAIGFI